MRLDLCGERDQPVGLPRHRGEHHHEVVPVAFHLATRRATFRMRSGEPTEVPPYFWTMRAMGKGCDSS